MVGPDGAPITPPWVPDVTLICRIGTPASTIHFVMAVSELTNLLGLMGIQIREIEVEPHRLQPNLIMMVLKGAIEDGEAYTSARARASDHMGPQIIASFSPSWLDRHPEDKGWPHRVKAPREGGSSEAEGGIRQTLTGG